MISETILKLRVTSAALEIYLRTIMTMLAWLWLQLCVWVRTMFTEWRQLMHTKENLQNRQNKIASMTKKSVCQKTTAGETIERKKDHSYPPNGYAFDGVCMWSLSFIITQFLGLSPHLLESHITCHLSLWSLRGRSTQFQRVVTIVKMRPWEPHLRNFWMQYRLNI